MKQNLVLVAEDDEDIRDMLTLTLEKAGFNTVGAKDGHIAARILTVAKPIGLITDVRMPAMNGMELARLARSRPDNRDTAILMISANTHAYDVTAGLESGADRFLAKPVSPRRLVAELQDLISSRFPTLP